MSEQFKTSALIDDGLLEIGDGYRAKNSELSNSGFPFARAGNLNNGFNFNDADYFPKENIKKVGRKISQIGDVVFTSKGTVGRFGFVHDGVEQFVYSPQLCYWRSLDHKKILPRFLYYWMNSSEFWSQAASVKGQTDMADYVSLTDQRRMAITIPDFSKQEEISNVLGALDDKIELNRQMNHTLEQMAQSLYKSWFVDFDPVVAKAAGKKPFGMSDEVAALFPDRFVDSELGEIPAGWEVGTLKNVTNILNGYAFKSKDWQDHGVPVVKIKSVKPGIVNLDDVSYVSEAIAEEQNRFRLKTGDILIGLTGYPGEVGIIPPTNNPPLLNQRVGKFLFETDKNYNKSFIYFGCRFSEFKDEVEKYAHGTAQLNISSSDVLNIKLIIPKKELIQAYSKVTDNFLKMIISNYGEFSDLTQARNTLLPKLLSGEIRLKQAEKIVSEAV